MTAILEQDPAQAADEESAAAENNKRQIGLSTPKGNCVSDPPLQNRSQPDKKRSQQYLAGRNHRGTVPGWGGGAAEGPGAGGSF